LKARLNKAIELYQDHYVKQILVTGYTVKEGYDEAVVMAAFVRQKLPAVKILLDHHGITTRDSAVNCSRMLVGQEINVVSQYFHITRTKWAFRKFPFVAIYSAHANFYEIRDLYGITRENAAMLKHWLFGYV